MLSSVHIQDFNSIQHCWSLNKLEMVTGGFIRPLVGQKHMRLTDICRVIIEYVTCFQFTCDDIQCHQENERQLILFSINDNLKHLFIKVKAHKEYFFRCGIIEISKQFISQICPTATSEENGVMEFETKILSKAMNAQDDELKSSSYTGLRRLYHDIWRTISTIGSENGIKDENNCNCDYVKPCSMVGNQLHGNKIIPDFENRFKQHLKQLKNYLNNSRKVNIKFVTYGCSTSDDEDEDQYWCDFGMNDAHECIELYNKHCNTCTDFPLNEFAFPLRELIDSDNCDYQNCPSDTINVSVEKLENDNSKGYYLNFVKDGKSLIKQWKQLLLIDHQNNVYYYVFECVAADDDQLQGCQYQIDIY